MKFAVLSQPPFGSINRNQEGIQWAFQALKFGEGFLVPLDRIRTADGFPGYSSDIFAKVKDFDDEPLVLRTATVYVETEAFW